MDHKEKTRLSRSEEIGKIIAKYIETNDFADRSTIVTVTDVVLNDRLDSAKVYLSVFPKEKELLIFPEIEKDIYHLQNHLNTHLRCRLAPRIKLLLVQEN
ncbi:MAG: ribosome-binding factor A [Candidatus Paceibacterota bacterium]|jgi:ribosome-binding factor A